jgi:Caspase domain
VDKYNFSVEDKRLEATKPAQLQLNQHLANFVAEKHDENGLLIFYYAGHGIPGDMPGTLTLAGYASCQYNAFSSANIDHRSRNPEHHDSEKKKKLNQIVWHRAENLLKDSFGDVLIIFDCCGAGTLTRDIRARGRWPQRAFEFLGATSAEDTTPGPGPNSFTAGLIWALEKLANQSGFTPSELLQEITQAPEFPRDQYPVHHDRDKPSLRKIVISPLLQDGSRQKETAAKTSTAPAERLEFLDLRVMLSHHPTKDDISSMAHALKEMLRTQSMSVARHIAWGKLSAIEVPTEIFPNLVWSLLTVKTFPKRWREIRDKRATKDGLHCAENPDSHASSSHSNGVSADPPSPSRKRQRM